MLLFPAQKNWWQELIEKHTQNQMPKKREREREEKLYGTGNLGKGFYFFCLHEW